MSKKRKPEGRHRPLVVFFLLALWLFVPLPLDYGQQVRKPPAIPNKSQTTSPPPSPTQEPGRGKGTGKGGSPPAQAPARKPGQSETRGSGSHLGKGWWRGIFGSNDRAASEEAGPQASGMVVDRDPEQICWQSIEKSKIYLHMGDPSNTTGEDRTAYVEGTITYDSGIFVGISLQGTGVTKNDLERDGNGNLTGKIVGAMKGSKDVIQQEISGEGFDATFLLDWGSGFQPPLTFGSGGHGTIPETLWWLVDQGNPGTHQLTWKIIFHMPAHQADGNYHFHPTLVAAPEL